MKWQILDFQHLDSTQAYLRSKANTLDEGAVVMAQEQSQGVGRKGDPWISESGGLYFSLLLKPQRILQDLPLVFLLALSEWLRGYIPSELSVKWPNDVYVQDKKISGFLIDSQIMGKQPLYYICGVGLNLNQPSFSEALTAISVFLITQTRLKRHHVLSEFLDIFERHYELLLYQPEVFKSRFIQFFKEIPCFDQLKNRMGPEVFCYGRN